MANFSITADVLTLQPVIPSPVVAAAVTQTERLPQGRAADLRLTLGILNDLSVQAVISQTGRAPQRRLAGPVVTLQGQSVAPLPPTSLLPRWRRPERVIPGL
jgi:hypothetical protein